MKGNFPFEIYSNIVQCPKLSNYNSLKEEQRLAVDVANMLRAYSLKGELEGVFMAIPNEGKRTRFTGAIMKAMGLLPGAPDYVIIGKHGENSLLIELKTSSKASRQSKTQKFFQLWAQLHEIQYHVCRSLEEVRDLLIKNNLLRVTLQ